MEPGVFGSVFVSLIIVFSAFLRVSGNSEGDALNALKSNLEDPNNVLQSWNATLVNPCTWDHVTCNSDKSVITVDLGNANLSGQLVPQLGQLTNLQSLELHNNNISGKIPKELGNLTNLVSLDLSMNNLNGTIPDTLGKLTKLRFLYEYTSFRNFLQSLNFLTFQLIQLPSYFFLCLLIKRIAHNKLV